MLSKCPSSPNEIGNFCVFTCKVCKKESKTMRNLRIHLDSSNHRDEKLDLMDYATKIVSHRCKLCSTWMLCENAKILKHLGTHKLNIKDYCRKTGCDLNSRNYRSTPKFHELLSKASKSEDVGNLCRYRCKFCGVDEFTTWQATKRHLTRAHRGKDEDGGHMTNWGMSEFIIRSVAHECLLCGEDVFCDRFFLQRHLLLHHDHLSVKDYVHRYGLRFLLEEEETSLNTEEEPLDILEEGEFVSA